MSLLASCDINGHEIKRDRKRAVQVFIMSGYSIKLGKDCTPVKPGTGNFRVPELPIRSSICFMKATIALVFPENVVFQK
jgi:hypothetical protein